MTEHSATAVLHRRAYEALVKKWTLRDVTRFDMRFADGKWRVVADVYHDLDRAPSYTSHDDVMGDLEQHEAAQLLQDLQRARRAT